ncbi:MAG: MFS transporter [Sphingomonadales bacterium]|nr:MFS transporter [Sphingomonadales bacterium]
MTTPREEWAASWPLPPVGMLGIAGSTLFPMVSGLLIVPLTGAFGWSRAQFSLAMLLQVLVGLVLGPIAGRMVDRHGPRRVLLAGIPAMACGFGLLGLVNGPIWQWWLAVVLLGVTMAPVLPVSWMAAIISRFDAARGLAMAIALAGVGLGSAVWPVLGARLLATWGWRAVYPALGIGWAAVLLPLAWATLPRTPSARSAQTTAVPGACGQTLRSSTFLLLTAAGSIFIATIYGINLNLVPILTGLGYSIGQAAGIAGLAGLSAIAGRVLTGLLLDLLPTRLLAVATFLLPLVSIALLSRLGAPGGTVVAAVTLLGFSLGAETDVIAFIASRRFDSRVFASAYSVSSAVFSVCAALGPLLANRVFDASHSYHGFFLAAFPAIAIGAILVALVPQPSRTR